MFDRDGGGSISAKEVAEILGYHLLNKADNKVWNDIISEVDQNNDGEIDFSEFKQMMALMIEKKEE